MQSLKRLTWLEDDIHQFFAWGWYSSTKKSTNFVKLYRGDTQFIVQVGIPNGIDKEQIRSYCAYMSTLRFPTPWEPNASVHYIGQEKNTLLFWIPNSCLLRKAPWN
jgi:hypothetical protein